MSKRRRNLINVWVCPKCGPSKPNVVHAVWECKRIRGILRLRFHLIGNVRGEIKISMWLTPLHVVVEDIRILCKPQILETSFIWFYWLQNTVCNIQ